MFIMPIATTIRQALTFCMEHSISAIKYVWTEGNDLHIYIYVCVFKHMTLYFIHIEWKNLSH